MNSITIFALAIEDGDVAQLVEQRTENPCVGGSIPSITTRKLQDYFWSFFYSLFPDTRIFDYCVAGFPVCLTQSGRDSLHHHSEAPGLFLELFFIPYSPDTRIFDYCAAGFPVCMTQSGRDSLHHHRHLFRD